MNRLTRVNLIGLVVIVASMCCQLTCQLTGAEEPESSPPRKASVDFVNDVYPILRRSCIECHGPKKQEGDFRLDQLESALESGAIEVGELDDSELLRRVGLPRGHDEVMPPIGDPLSKRQVATIRKWIRQGAKWPEQFDIESHWAYVVPQRPKTPAVAEPIGGVRRLTISF